jgi:CRP/FNR family transcriptional regulator
MGITNITPDLSRDPHLQELAREAMSLLRSHFHPRHFRKGNLLWREGDTTGMLVALRTGRVKVYRLLPAGRAVTLFLFGPGDVFGFLPFLDGESYPAYAQALEDVEADVMPRSALFQALRAEPDVAITLIALLGRRLRATFDLVQSLSTPGARGRVAAALVALLPDAPTGTGAPELRLPVAGHEFAGALGLVPETFSRALTSLVQDRILARTDTGGYRVLDRTALERAADAP